MYICIYVYCIYIRGKYWNETAGNVDLMCSECPAQTYSPAGSSIVSNCTCNKGYTGLNGVECAACNAGTYKDVNGSAPCSLCHQDKYSTETGQISESTCRDCPTYTFSGPGSIALVNCTCGKGYTGNDGEPCNECAVGKFKDTNGSAPCTQCPAGKHSGTTGRTSMTACIDCPRDSYNSTDNGDCISCPRGSHSPLSSDELTDCLCNVGYTGPNGCACKACAAGTWKDVNGSSPCLLCSRGKYSMTTAAIAKSVCSSCPSYTYSSLGSSVLSNCTCDKGYTGPDGVECTACITGTYKDVNGSSPCSVCLRGTYSTATAAISKTTCQSCPPYTSSGAGTKLLTNCICNKGYTGPNGAECAACIAGTYKNVSGSTACTKCQPGKIGYETAAISESICVPCLEDTYHHAEGSMTCTPCPRRSHSVPGSTSCQCDKHFRRRDAEDRHQGCLLRIPPNRSSVGAFRYFIVQTSLLLTSNASTNSVEQSLLLAVSEFFTIDPDQISMTIFNSSQRARRESQGTKTMQ